MIFKNQTKNQHFLSRIEQRLNAINVNSEKGSMKIFSFLLLERDECKVELESKTGSRISTNLSYVDLYSFEFLDNGVRHNFEEAFGKYEEKIQSATLNFINKIESKSDDVLEELIDVLAMKFLNFIRNPFNIKKVLNTFGDLANYFPLNSQLRTEYDKIEKRNDKGVDRMCQLFDVEKDEYFKWMRIIFLILMDSENKGMNMLDDIIYQFITDKKQAIAVWVYKFTDENEDKKVCLSDRSFVDLEGPESGNLVMAFNLTANCFIKLAMMDVRTILEKSPERPDTLDNLMAILDVLPKNIEIRLLLNGDHAIEALAHYNRTAILQCHERVYCSSSNIYGL
ncbi:hypothetical protein ACIP6T_22720 [Pantoea sp. NPDC088449]|uniref:hypothetical protein n=1 Tax=Pantoea sp. NPDC088449 TaxID=3364392 RepID=UPI00382FE8CF